ncbi:MAG: hypothetical protein ABW023_05865 [Sphingomonas sp.]
MSDIAGILPTIPMAEIDAVIFYKRDEITTDLICCEISTAHTHWRFHEEMKGWDTLLNWLRQLPGFREDWFAQVSQPPFAESRFVAFGR